MRGGNGFLGGWRPDRVLALALGAGTLLAAAVIYIHTGNRLADVRGGIARDLTTRAEILDGRLHAAVAQLEILRIQAGAFARRPPSPEGTAPDPLLSAFLASNPEEASTHFYSLDRMPPPFETERPGNMVALSTMSARRRPGLSRPDPAAWTRDAALGLELLPAMAAAKAGLPGIRRIYFAASTGLVAFSPWEMSGASELMDSFPASPLYRAAMRNGAKEPLWSLMAADGQVSVAAAEAPPPRSIGIAPERYSTVALPLARDDGPIGILAAQIDLTEVLKGLGAPGDEGARLILASRDGRVLAESAGPKAAEALPGLPPDQLAGLTAGPVELDGMYLSAAKLDQGKMLLVHVIDRDSVLMPVLAAELGSLGLLSLTLGLILVLSVRTMRHALNERETAVAAERTVRAASERALDDLRAAHDELDFLNREKTRFFSLISHDLRGPFNALLGMTEELAEHGPQMAPDDVADFARTTHQSARKVFDLLENLLQWSRVQMSGRPFAPSVFALRELVADAIRDVQSAAEAKDITVLDAVGDRWVLADRTMILAVLRNLLVNAVKFSHPGGLVHITSRALGDRLEVAVTDRGIGMEPEQLQALLRAGAGQASRPGTQGEVGTGLGLTLVRDLVLRHGGELKVSSTPADGTVVSFTVPLSAAPAEQRARIPVSAE